MNKQQEPYNALLEFVKILIKYMNKFGLEAIDIAFLAHSTRINIQNLLDLKGSLELERMESIAQAFELHHYQFSDPKQKIPEYKSLSERTRKRIEYRKQNGPYVPENRNTSTINEKITVALSFLEMGDEFLTEQLVEKINTVDADITTTTSIVGDRLAKSFSKQVENTNRPNLDKKGKGAKPVYFKLLSSISEKQLRDAIEVLGQYWFQNYKKITERESDRNKR